MIAQTLQVKIGEAMKAHDETLVSTLRLLLSAFNYEKIDKQHDLTDEEEMVVIRREAKKRKESAEMYRNAGAEDRAKKEEAELAILAVYLPSEMSEEEIIQLVNEAINQLGAKTIADMGKVIGYVKGKAPNADGGKVAVIVKQKLAV